ncbi:PLP-dependent aminotransferase family protein [Azorhizobium doebereinerae]|uniref:aminotransferase-like domain-containing protein n=1 Tax=Azorhizobium doebereinerae TaxID=281091 RepID=UPI00048C4685|nr:PLP-dependent aminotransferase family protein [Azorhizobium doebereinerae]
MTDWVPALSHHRGPRYMAIVEQLESDIASGEVKPGARLLPQRDMAERLGLSVGTISKAYAEAEQRGLISGEVGRGTFVLRRRFNGHKTESTGREGINLALNVPPATGEDALIAATLAEVVADGGIDRLLGYLPHQGLPDHRAAVASWLAAHGMATDPDRVFITHGAQHALSIAIGMVAARGDTVLTESLTYSGMLALSAQSGYRLHGVAMDIHGLVPEALDAAFAETGARVLYTMPSLQTPTGTVMPAERRLAIAEIIRRRDAYVLEDDAYAFLFQTPPRPVSALAPERSFYAMSFAKCLAPGLRIGAMIVPDAFRDRCINAVRATGWMASPIMAEVVSRLVQNGGLARQAMLKREKAVLRDQVVRRVLSGWLSPVSAPPGFHVWLPLPAGRTLTSLITQSAQAGITLAPPGALRPLDAASLGVRICLGAPTTEAQLETALTEVRRILEQAEAISLV